MNDTVALIGNPNCGKTTLFNALTGTYQKTGNWTGVTTEKKEGVYRKNKVVKLIDLPGLYALNKGSQDENAVLEYLRKTPPKVIINVLDGTNLERNLYLTLELVELGIPIVLAVNMFDDLEKNGIKLNANRLSSLFGVPVVPVSALKNINTDKLMAEAINVGNKPIQPDFASYKGNGYKEKRYAFIERHVSAILLKKTTVAERFTQRADDVLTHKIWGIPIFIAIITTVYFLSSKLGGLLGGYVSVFFLDFASNTSQSMAVIGIQEWAIDLVCNAVFKGLGGVLFFLPQILILFTLLTVLEESGYASRVAFIFDRLFRSFGLGGKSLIPLMVSCGCTVTGVMATRTIESEGEKRMTLFLAPFMPCGAKMAVFAWFSELFFCGNALISTSLYFVGIIVAAICGAILKRFKAFGGNGTFILEIPTLRLPSIKDILCVLWEKVKDFTAKAGTVILAVSVVLWALQNVGIYGYTNGEVERSFLYVIGNSLKYVFYPLGFGNWQATVAVFSGVLAKEAVIETLEITCVDVSTLFYNSWSAYGFMAFVLLSPPCIASIAAAKRELKSFKWLALMLLFHTLVAYLVTFLINLIGFLIECVGGLLLSIIIVIMIIVLSFTAIKTLLTMRCKNCVVCKKGDKKCIKRNTI